RSVPGRRVSKAPPVDLGEASASSAIRPPRPRAPSLPIPRRRPGGASPAHLGEALVAGAGLPGLARAHLGEEPGAECATVGVMTAGKSRGGGHRGRPGYDGDSLMEVAVAVFNERGYDGTGMEELSRRLGITKSAIYHHVSGKEELLD